MISLLPLGEELGMRDEVPKAERFEKRRKIPPVTNKNTTRIRVVFLFKNFKILYCGNGSPNEVEHKCVPRSLEESCNHECERAREIEDHEHVSHPWDDMKHC